MASAYSREQASNIRRNVKHANSVIPLTEENNRLLDLLDQIDIMASYIEKEETGNETTNT